jgi:hypothetical protein
MFPSMGPRLARELGTVSRGPAIQCDSCGKLVVARGTHAPAWLLRGLPRGWVRHERLDVIRHFCTQCKVKHA